VLGSIQKYKIQTFELSHVPRTSLLSEALWLTDFASNLYFVLFQQKLKKQLQKCTVGHLDLDSYDMYSDKLA
jgi:hypothetical protein